MYSFGWLARAGHRATWHCRANGEGMINKEVGGSYIWRPGDGRNNGFLWRLIKAEADDDNIDQVQMIAMRERGEIDSDYPHAMYGPLRTTGRIRIIEMKGEDWPTRHRRPLPPDPATDPGVTPGRTGVWSHFIAGLLLVGGGILVGWLLGS